jgi:hypothetical protein
MSNNITFINLIANVYFQTAIRTTKIILIFIPQHGKTTITLTNLHCSYVPPIVLVMNSNAFTYNYQTYISNASTYYISNDIPPITYPAYRAFNNSSDAWMSAYGTYDINTGIYIDNPSWLEIDLPNSVIVDCIYIMPVYVNMLLSQPLNFTFQAYINGTWTCIIPAYFNNTYDWLNVDGGYGTYFFIPYNNYSASKYRIVINKVNNSSVTSIADLQLYSI